MRSPDPKCQSPGRMGGVQLASTGSPETSTESIDRSLKDRLFANRSFAG
jgi:hypothetical protein